MCPQAGSLSLREKDALEFSEADPPDPGAPLFLMGIVWTLGTCPQLKETDLPHSLIPRSAMGWADSCPLGWDLSGVGGGRVGFRPSLGVYPSTLRR